VEVTSDVDRVTPRTRELVDAVSIPIFAEHVAGALTGERDLEQALRALQGGRAEIVPGFEVPVVDTTGAGDVFRGAFIEARLRAAAPREAVRFANAAAALACTRYGAFGGVPARGEIEELLKTASAR
jgi:sugar/nucleoside kinase (ribokinase family)